MLPVHPGAFGKPALDLGPVEGKKKTKEETAFERHGRDVAGPGVRQPESLRFSSCPERSSSDIGQARSSKRTPMSFGRGSTSHDQNLTTGSNL